MIFTLEFECPDRNGVPLVGNKLLFNDKNNNKKDTIMERLFGNDEKSYTFFYIIWYLKCGQHFWALPNYLTVCINFR